MRKHRFFFSNEMRKNRFFQEKCVKTFKLFNAIDFESKTCLDLCAAYF